MPASFKPLIALAGRTGVLLLSLALAPVARGAPSTKIPVKPCRNVENLEGVVGTVEEGRFAHEREHVIPGSASDVHGFTFFTNGEDGAIGPGAWTCDSEVGPNGSTALRVHPPGRAGTNDPGITVVTSGGGSVGLALALACGYFPGARKLALEWSMGFACSGTTANRREPGETRVLLSERHVRYERRSGEEGKSGLSGGALGVHGVVVFDTSPDPYAARLSCSVDASTRSVCEVAAKAFVADYPPRPTSGSAR